MILDLTLAQKNRLLSILPDYPAKATGRKRVDVVNVFLGILWVLKTGARWEDIDKRQYASRQTCQRYFSEWVESGVFVKALEMLVQEMEEGGLIKLHESFVDGTFVEAKKGVSRSA